MNVTVKKSSSANKPAPTSEEVNAVLNKIFDAASEAIRTNQQKITLECVDKTLGALFDAVNKVHSQGSNVAVPDFQKLLNSNAK